MCVLTCRVFERARASSGKSRPRGAHRAPPPIACSHAPKRIRPSGEVRAQGETERETAAPLCADKRRGGRNELCACVLCARATTAAAAIVRLRRQQCARRVRRVTHAQVARPTASLALSLSRLAACRQPVQTAHTQSCRRSDEVACQLCSRANNC